MPEKYIELDSASLHTLEDAVTDFASLEAWVAQTKMMIPEEFRASASVDFSTDFNDGWSLTISYYRPETEEDRQRAQAEVEAFEQRRVAHRRAEFEKLKAEFEPEA